MVPDDDSSSNDITSPRNIAQILATYQQMSGGRKSSALSESLMAGNDTDLLRTIVSDLENIKQGGGATQTTAGRSMSRDSYKYMDDKALYSSDG